MSGQTTRICGLSIFDLRTEEDRLGDHGSLSAEYHSLAIFVIHLKAKHEQLQGDAFTSEIRL
jgi:hypothetical protein